MCNMLTSHQEAFHGELKKAQAVVQEPAQPPKIKLKVAQGTETPSSAKKITIHVGGRGGSADSPAPAVSQSADTPSGGVNGVTRTSSRLDATRSVSASVPSPSPSAQVGLKTEEMAPVSSAVVAQPSGGNPAAARPQIAVMAPQPLPQAVPVNPVGSYVEQKRLRRAGKGASWNALDCVVCLLINI